MLLDDEKMSPIKKRIRFNADNKTWTIGNEETHSRTIPRIFWYHDSEDRYLNGFYIWIAQIRSLDLDLDLIVFIL